MNRGNSQKWLIWGIVVLAVLNLASLSALWYVRLDHQAPPPPRERNASLEDIIVHQVGLDPQQEAKFRELHLRHRQVKDSLENESYRLKEQLQNELFAVAPDTTKMATLANRIGGLEAEFERQVYRHFLELKALCRPDQYPKLEMVLNDLLSASRPRPRAKPDNPPDDRRPPRPDDRNPPRPAN